ncbi:MAG: phosphoribosylglycinamide formyltransferase [Oscillospiraceae bacterium]|nr:phosphoribosylglycinamide formyltransferase [Oscillospiraceae bacterium]MBQ8731306.1 phosphoribosylglycinamide formyltransferase [Oscillospiraceae bacterium]
MKHIAVFVSGGGTNLAALIEAEKSGLLKSGTIRCVISSREDAYALTRAQENGIRTYVVRKKDFASQGEQDAHMISILESEQIDLIVLAGYMSILSEEFTRTYQNRIINVHPALIPSFCGDGYYGLRVHQAALDYGVRLTGATVHFVNEVTDGGAIILQKAVEIKEGDTPEILQRRVMEEAEWKLLPQACELFCADRLEVSGRKVTIKE